MRDEKHATFVVSKVLTRAATGMILYAFDAKNIIEVDSTKRDLRRDAGSTPENSTVDVIKIDVTSDTKHANKLAMFELPSAARETSLNVNAIWKLRTSASR